MNKYNKQTIFHLPGIFFHFNIYETFINEINICPDILKDNVKIGSIYGAPPVKWNGGRLMSGNFKEIFNEQYLLHCKNFMEKNNIPVRFTFSNCLIGTEHLLDEDCNLLLQIFNNGKNEIICNSILLELYIRGVYNNNYKYISSTTKRLINKDEQLNEIEKDYYLTVIDYDYNLDFEFLKSIHNKDKCELLCNPVCKPNCPIRKEHYELISQAQLEGLNELGPICDDTNKRFWQMKESPIFISIEKINNIYLPMGFSNFKIEGRTHDPFDLIEILLYYLIKEEYKDEIRGKLHELILYPKN